MYVPQSPRVGYSGAESLPWSGRAWGWGLTLDGAVHLVTPGFFINLFCE